MPVWEEEREEGEGNGMGCSPGGEPEPEHELAGSFVLRLFSLSCRRGRSQGRVSAEYSSVLQAYSFRVLVSVPGQGVLLHCSRSWLCPPGVAAFLGVELKYN